MDTSKFSWSDREIKYFREDLQNLTSISNQPISGCGLISAFLICHQLIAFVPIVLMPIEPKSTRSLLRARANHNGEIFSEVSKISYNRESIHNIKLGRFNKFQESLFYGVFPREGTGNSMVVTCSLEACKELLDEKNKAKSQYLTLCLFEVLDQFVVINLCLNEKNLSNNPRIKDWVLDSIARIKKDFPSKSAEFIIEFWTYFSNLSGRIEAEQRGAYMVLTGFFWAARVYYRFYKNENISGIIYPSSITECEGLSIVLTPDIVESSLKALEVVMCKFERDPNNSKAYFGAECTDVATIKDDKFSFMYVR